MVLLLATLCSWALQLFLGAQVHSSGPWFCYSSLFQAPSSGCTTVPFPESFWLYCIFFSKRLLLALLLFLSQVPCSGFTSVPSPSSFVWLYYCSFSKLLLLFLPLFHFQVPTSELALAPCPNLFLALGRVPGPVPWPPALATGHTSTGDLGLWPGCVPRSFSVR